MRGWPLYLCYKRGAACDLKSIRVNEVFRAPGGVERANMPGQYRMWLCGYGGVLVCVGLSAA